MRCAANFDCPDPALVHGFLLYLTGGEDDRAEIHEVFGPPKGAKGADRFPMTLPRCILPRRIFALVKDEVGAEFNRRLRQDGKPAGRWGAEATALQRLMAIELLVLLWAVEEPDVTDADVEVALRNWLGLKPEERWWLHFMTAAATGHADQRGVGWRGALRQALCFDTREGRFVGRPHDAPFAATAVPGCVRPGPPSTS